MQILKELGPINKSKPAKNSHPLAVIAEKFEVDDDENESIVDLAAEVRPDEEPALVDATFKAVKAKKKNDAPADSAALS